MTCEHDGFSVGRERRSRFEHFERILDIKVRGRFVEKNEVGVFPEGEEVLYRLKRVVEYRVARLVKNSDSADKMRFL